MMPYRSGWVPSGQVRVTVQPCPHVKPFRQFRGDQWRFGHVLDTTHDVWRLDQDLLLRNMTIHILCRIRFQSNPLREIGRDQRPRLWGVAHSLTWTVSLLLLYQPSLRFHTPDVVNPKASVPLVVRSQGSLRHPPRCSFGESLRNSQRLAGEHPFLFKALHSQLEVLT